jgi:hypothetical protein
MFSETLTEFEPVQLSAQLRPDELTLQILAEHELQDKNLGCVSKPLMVEPNFRDILSIEDDAGATGCMPSEGV